MTNPSDRIVQIVFFMLLWPSIGLTAPQDETRSRYIYISPQDWRDAESGYELTDWLRFSALLEAGYERSEQAYPASAGELSNNEGVLLTQLALFAVLSDRFSFEFVGEFEKDRLRTVSNIDEAILKYVYDDVEIELGRLVLPFGEYYSHLVVDPSLTFGEKGSDAIVMTWSMADSVDVSVFVADGEYAEAGGSETDLGFSIEWHNQDESLKAATSWLSDMADTDAELLAGSGFTTQSSVAGINVNLLAGFGDIEFTAEFVTVLDDFTGLAPQFNRPAAINLELAYLPSRELQYAVRIERSRELDDAPEFTVGLGVTLVLQDAMTLSLDYLHGTYAAGLILDDNAMALDNIDIIAVELAWTF